MRDRNVRTRVIGTAVSVALFALLVRAIVALPAATSGLAPEMRSGAEAIEIKNVVTAVLLDFRGYDTLLEIAVLMLATVAVLAVREGPSDTAARIEERATTVLHTLTMALLPLMLLVAGHLVWIGSSAPGGAFQAGAVLGAAAIMLALSGYARPGWVGAGAMRGVLAIGLLAFIAVALGSVTVGGALLEYPDEHRKALILFIEVLLTLSIGASIGSLFLASASGVTERKRP
jgi:multisubunit Na+/H+ antiporter MnhB subunit